MGAGAASVTPHAPVPRAASLPVPLAHAVRPLYRARSTHYRSGAAGLMRTLTTVPLRGHAPPREQRPCGTWRDATRSKAAWRVVGTYGQAHGQNPGSTAVCVRQRQWLQRCCISAGSRQSEGGWAHTPQPRVLQASCVALTPGRHQSDNSSLGAAVLRAWNSFSVVGGGSRCSTGCVHSAEQASHDARGACATVGGLTRTRQRHTASQIAPHESNLCPAPHTDQHNADARGSRRREPEAQPEPLPGPLRWPWTRQAPTKSAMACPRARAWPTQVPTLYAQKWPQKGVN